MKSIPSAFQTMLNSNTTTFCLCWKVTTTGGTVKGFTNHVEDIEISGLTYKSNSGFTPTAAKYNAELAVDNHDVKFLLGFDGTEEADLIAGVYDFATIEVFFVDYTNISGSNTVPYVSGQIGEISIERTTAVTEIRGVTQYLQQQIVEEYSPSCRADLGDSRCKFNIASLTVTGTVSGVTDNRTFQTNTIGITANADDYYNHGLVTWTAGNNDGRKMEVKDFVKSTGQIELYQAMPEAIQIGDTFTVYPGCDKSITTCRDKFNNVVNFRGEPHVPGEDQLMRFGGQ